jgi:hypothetical protein
MTNQECSFYGPISEGATSADLIRILTAGLRAFFDDIEYIINHETALDILDRWFEHDSVRKRRFCDAFDDDEVLDQIVDGAMKDLDLSKKKGSWDSITEEDEEAIRQLTLSFER